MPGLSPDPIKRERQLSNLKTDAGPGRPKGSRNWSTVTRELLDDEELFEKLMQSQPQVPLWLKNTNTKTLMQAITIAQSLKALNGSHFSAEWVRKTGFGDKIDITSNGETIKIEPVIISSIRPRNAIEGEIVEPKQIEESDEPTASPETS